MNAIEAKVARSARVSATSTVAGTSVTLPSSSKAAIPPVPIDCAAIMRSASPGPRRMQISPSASIARMKPRAAVMNSVTTQGLRQRRFFGGQLRYYRLVDVEAVEDELFVLVCDRHCAGQQARERGERVAGCTAREAHGVDPEPRSQRQSRVECTPSDIGCGYGGLVQETERKPNDVHGRHARPAVGSEQSQTRQGGRENGRGPR